jgi:hypothetical protein
LKDFKDYDEKACSWGRETSGSRSLRNANYANFMNLDLIVGSDFNSYLQCRKLEIFKFD